MLRLSLPGIAGAGAALPGGLLPLTAFGRW